MKVLVEYDMENWRTPKIHSINKHVFKPDAKDVVIVLFVFVLMGWSLLPNAMRPFKIYYAPPNLVIRT